MPRTVDNDNTAWRKDKLLTAFAEVLAENGAADASFKTIGTKADMSPSLLGYYFKNKDNLWTHLVDHLEQGFTSRLARLDKKATNQNERLEAFVDAHLARGTDPVAVKAWVVCAGEASRTKKLKNALSDAQKRSADALSERMADAGIPDAEAHAPLILATIHGAWQQRSAGGVLPRTREAAAVKGLLQALKS